jgi:hypothetical protein
LMKDVSMANQEIINTKGYIFARVLPQINGCYFSDSCTCTAATSDFSNIENNRVIDKVIRYTYVTLAPKLNEPQQVDATTGKLLADKIAYYESICDKAIAPMLTNSEVSGIRYYIDPAQNFLATNLLNVKCRVTPTGKNKDIVVDIALNNPANQ